MPDGSDIQLQGPVTFPDGSQFDLSADPDFSQSIVPTEVVRSLAGNLWKTQNQTHAIKADRHLSDTGRAFKVEEHEDQLIRSVAQAKERLDQMSTAIEARWSEWHKPTPLEPTNSVGYMEDESRRAFLERCTPAKRTALLSEMAQGKHEGFMLAILRSPVPLGFEVDVAKKAWAAKVDASDPVKAASLASGLRSAEWGKRKLAELEGISLRTVKPNAQRMKRLGLA